MTHEFSPSNKNPHDIDTEHSEFLSRMDDNESRLMSANNDVLAGFVADGKPGEVWLYLDPNDFAPDNPKKLPAGPVEDDGYHRLILNRVLADNNVDPAEAEEERALDEDKRVVLLHRRHRAPIMTEAGLKYLKLDEVHMFERNKTDGTTSKKLALKAIINQTKTNWPGNNEQQYL